jgi:fucose permease
VRLEQAAISRLALRDERRTIRAAYGCLFLIGINLGWIGPFLPEIARTLAIRLDSAGLIVSAVGAGYFPALLVATRFAERFGPSPVLVSAAFLFAAGFAGLAFAPSLVILIVAAAVVGFGAAASDVSTNSIVAHLNRERLASALNYLHLMFGVGAFVGPIVAGFALAMRISYSVTFLGGAFLALAIAISIAGTMRVDSDSPPESALPNARMIVDPVVIAISAILLLYVGAEAGIGAWLYSYLRVTTRLSESISSWAVSLYWLGLVAGRGAGARLSHRVTVYRFTLLACAISALALAGLLGAPRFAGAAIFAIGLGFGPIFPNMIAVGAARFPSQVARMTSIVAAAASIGGMVVPWIMGRAMVIAGARSSMEIALAATVLMLLIAPAIEWLAESR